MGERFDDQVVSGSGNRESYRCLRRQLLSGLQEDRRPVHGQRAEEAEQPHPLHDLRQRVIAMRERLFWDHADDRGLSDALSAEARRALGIPDDLRLSYPFSHRVLQGAAGAFVPAHFMVRMARRQLRRVKTYQGRRLLFSAVLRRFFMAGQRLSLTDTLDFVLRHLEGKATHEELHALERCDLHWVRSFYKLGVHSAPSLLAHLRPRPDSDAGPLIELLVDEQVIQTPAELKAWPKRPQYLAGLGREAPHHLGNARKVIKHLVRMGVPRAAIAKACTVDRPDFRPTRLQENLAVLAEHGICVPTLAAGIGKLLWVTTPQRWRFLVDVLQLRAAEDLVLFAELLERESAPNADLAHALLRMQATPHDLADCQRVLLLEPDTKDTGTPVRALERLARSPFSFRPAEFGRVRDFARNDQDLEMFLAHLVRHGLVAPQDVLDFERCYRGMSVDVFGRLLDVGAPRRGGAPADAIANWAVRAAQIGRVDACEVAADLLRLSALSDLARMLAVAPLGASVLRYLIVDKQLKPLDKLLGWFYDDAPGVLEIKLSWPLGEIERAALDDAFERKRFNVVNHNIGCTYAARRHRAVAQMGPRPAYDDRSACDIYDHALSQLMDGLQPTLVQQMRDVLSLTGGVLLTGLLDATSPAEVHARLATLKPLLADLLVGRGPAASQITAFEAEAVALVYGVTPTGVEEIWPQLVGHPHDIGHLALAEHYPMRWRQAHRRLQEGARLDARGLAAIGRLPGLVEAFNARWKTDMFEACKGLRPSRIDDRAADVDGLLHHLAVLCAIASGDEQVAAALQRWQKIQAGLLAGSVPYAELEYLRAFFDTILPDALDVQAPERLRALTGDAATCLIHRLGVKLPADIQHEHDRLVQAIAAVRSRVLPIYAKWNARERGKFPKLGNEQGETALHAIVSKTPAAFFAKEAVGLCTRHNVAMWKEARHSHLVVFDPVQKCLAGMAMLYLEIIPAIDATRPVLIIRALNPIARFADQHDCATIVDTFFATAMMIAADNNLAAVAFPGDGGMHLISNASEIEHDVCKRYMRPANGHCVAWPTWKENEGRLARAVRIETTFHGYAVGEGGSVSSLYVIWHRAGSAAAGAK